MSNVLLALCCALAIEISGPTHVATPQPVTLEVAGLPVIDDAQPLTQQVTTLLTAHRFIVSAPDNSETQLRRRLFIGEEDGLPVWEIELTLAADLPGVYVVIGPQYTYHRLVVGGTGPNPNPTPKPTPTPTAKTAVLLLESRAQNVDQSILTNQMRNDRSMSNKIRMYDPDQKLASGVPDPQVQYLLTHGPPPRFFVLDDANNVVHHFQLPDTWQEARRQLQDAGLQP